MKKQILFKCLLLTILFGNSLLARDTKLFNQNWLFKLIEDSNAVKYDYDDSSWRKLSLPHDWSVEFSFTQENAAGATAFLPGGFGTYRKHFRLPKEYEGNKLTRIEFDGIYNNAKIWLNGKYLGEHPYGYSPFAIDLTKYLNYGDKDNVIAITVDKKAYIDCRWYPGSGIYRKVNLVNYDKINIPQHGVFVTTPSVSKDKATITIYTKIDNKNLKSEDIELLTTIIDKDDKIVGEASEKLTLDELQQRELTQIIQVNNPMLWDIETPNLYRVESQIVSKDNKCLDKTETRFGIRTIRYDAERGFFLNGRSVKFKGVCLHHDGGLVGAAVPKDVWRRRFELLKEAGCNAIRTAHNPASAEFLDLCDEMGFLVQEEFFDEFQNPKDKLKNYNQEKEIKEAIGYTTRFEEWSERDIETVMLRDRNRPSIVMWSIGNEIEWTYPEYGVSTGYWSQDRPKGLSYYYNEPPYSPERMMQEYNSRTDHRLGNTAMRLSSVVKRLDNTRPVTANLVMPTLSSATDYGKALDIIGYSYRTAVYDYGHKLYSNKMIYGAENWVRYSEWEGVANKDYAAGIFVWTGIFYLGESRNWPSKGSSSGMLDFAAFKRPSFYLFKSVWTPTPTLKIFTQKLDKSPFKYDAKTGNVIEPYEGWWRKQQWGWHALNQHWNYQSNDTVLVEVYGNSPVAELFLGKKSLGIKKLEDFGDKVIKWAVPYSEGELRVVGYDSKGKQLMTDKVATTKSAKKIVLEIDKTTLNKTDDGQVSHIVARVVDANNNPIQSQEFDLSFDVKGQNAKIYGVDNGASDNVQDFQATKITTREGKALFIVGHTGQSGDIVINAKSGKLKSQSITITVQ